MADTVSVKSMPDSGSREAVALTMAQFIWNAEFTEGRTFDRKVFLGLYVDCLRATLGHSIKE